MVVGQGLSHSRVIHDVVGQIEVVVVQSLEVACLKVSGDQGPPSHCQDVGNQFVGGTALGRGEGVGKKQGPLTMKRTHNNHCCE